MEILADVGGRPGIDCGGFCAYCYFRGVKPVPPFGCKHCLPFRKGCDYCTRAIIEGYPGFKPLDAVVFDVAQASYGVTPDKVTISGGGDLSCYPDLLKLVRILGQKNVPVHLGYTSGKGFRRGDEADELVDAGVREVSFTVFATDPELRRKYMHDKHPDAALSNLRIFCERCDVYAAAVLLKGVNDGKVLEKTCQDLEDMGAKGLILMRFANHPEQGLILGNAPIIPGQDVHTVEEFRDTVTEMNQRYRIRITGTPLWDPETKAPFSLAHNTDRLKSLPELRRSATIITGSIAAPLLERIFSALGGDVNVVPTKKDVACLMTIDDLRDIDLSRVKRTVVIPGRMLAHEREVKKELSKDGIDRLIVRGPDRLTVDGEMSISMTEEEVIELELEAFAELIDEINALGV